MHLYNRAVILTLYLNCTDQTCFLCVLVGVNVGEQNIIFLTQILPYWRPLFPLQTPSLRREPCCWGRTGSSQMSPRNQTLGSCQRKEDYRTPARCQSHLGGGGERWKIEEKKKFRRRTYTGSHMVLGAVSTRRRKSGAMVLRIV